MNHVVYLETIFGNTVFENIRNGNSYNKVSYNSNLDLQLNQITMQEDHKIYLYFV